MENAKQPNPRAELYMDHTELHIRIEKLKDFIVSDKYIGLPRVEQTDLSEQLRVMRELHKILGRRVSRSCNNA